MAVELDPTVGGMLVRCSAVSSGYRHEQEDLSILLTTGGGDKGSGAAAPAVRK